MDKWLKTGTLKKSASRTEIRTTDLAAMEITVDQQDDNHEVQMPTDWPVQIYRHNITCDENWDELKFSSQSYGSQRTTLFVYLQIICGESHNVFFNYIWLSDAQYINTTFNQVLFHLARGSDGMV
ncbi:hypothetical protein AVEN_115694-1 [Araneus ventricosus]|uniref:Uncharacterized protein n=1 Tax=Araneus ventricosus TaxID=182803 RepID=A0A4Y2NDP8_ARAVE|nr:hypothetical protein AVEN_115694-1 [Araneus ventricosus]